MLKISELINYKKFYFHFLGSRDRMPLGKRPLFYPPYKRKTND